MTPHATHLPASLRAMALTGTRRLVPIELPLPAPGPHELVLRVHTCGVCRTDLHVVDGDLAVPMLPLVPGHEIVGTVLARGDSVTAFTPGERVGAAWMRSTCLSCRWCAGGRENLCPDARFNGLHAHGGYATHAVVDARFAVPLPDGYDDVQAAPLLCAGLIGFRALRAAGDAPRIGIYGFGAAGHLVAQMAIAEGREVCAFTRDGDTAAQQLARRLGAVWAGATGDAPPQPLDAAILFAPVGDLVPLALRDVAPGGTVVCGGIHMSDIPAFPYRILWQERSVRSIANLTRADASGFMALAARTPIRCETQVFPLAAANDALDALRAGRITGVAVLDCERA